MRKIVTAAIVALLSISLSQSASADSIRDRQYWLEQFGFTSAWDSSQGDGVKVAVIDTGIDATHPSLRGSVVGGTDVSGLGTSDGLTLVGTSNYHAFQQERLFHALPREPDHAVIQSCWLHPILPSELHRILTRDCFQSVCY